MRFQGSAHRITPSGDIRIVRINKYDPEEIVVNIPQAKSKTVYVGFMGGGTDIVGSWLTPDEAEEIALAILVRVKELRED